MNINKLGKQNLGYRRGSNNLDLSSHNNFRVNSGSIKFKYSPTGLNSTKGKKKISFLNQKSSREVKISRLSQAKIPNNIQSIKVGSTGGIGDTGGNAPIRNQNSSRRNVGSLNSSGNKGKKVELKLK